MHSAQPPRSMPRVTREHGEHRLHLVGAEPGVLGEEPCNDPSDMRAAKLLPVIVEYPPRTQADAHVDPVGAKLHGGSGLQ